MRTDRNVTDLVTRVCLLFVAALAIVLYAIGASGCGPRPWHVTAHAVINAHAHALAAADGVVARAIESDPEQDPDVMRAHWTPIVISLRTSRNALITAERVVDGAQAVQDTAEHCRALQVVAESAQVVSQVAVTLRGAGVSVPPEVSQGARFGGALAESMARECASDGGL